MPLQTPPPEPILTGPPSSNLSANAGSIFFCTSSGNFEKTLNFEGTASPPSLNPTSFLIIFFGIGFTLTGSFIFAGILVGEFSGEDLYLGDKDQDEKAETEVYGNPDENND